MGNRVHEVLEWLYNERHERFTTFDILSEKFHEIWHENWHDQIFIADPRVTKEHIYTLGLRCLGNFCHKNGPIFNQPLYGTELKLEFTVGEYHFRGIIDRLDFTEENGWRVTDYKTSKRAKTEKSAQKDLQLTLYNLAVQQNFESSESIECGWNFLRHNQDVYVKLDKEQIEKNTKTIVNRVRKLEKNIQDGYSFFPKESLLCHWCYYWDECSAKSVNNPARKA